MKASAVFAARVLLAMAFAISAFIWLWFMVSTVRLCWELPFDRLGAVSAKALFTDPLPDRAGWVLIVSGIVFWVTVTWLRDRFISDLAKAIGDRVSSSVMMATTDFDENSEEARGRSKWPAS